jgi:hypothetical protein
MRNEIYFDTYRSTFDGGARVTHFFVKFNLPTITKFVDKHLMYYVKTADIPNVTIENHSIPHGIYEYKIPNNITANEWNVSLNVDRENRIIEAFYHWQNVITSCQYDPSYYMDDQRLYLVNNDGNVSSTYTIKHAWLKSIEADSLDYQHQDSVLSIKLNFAYLYYTFEIGGTLNA